MSYKEFDNISKFSRRGLLRRISMIPAGAGFAALLGAGCSPVSRPGPKDRSKILNYNAKMGYRRLGKTGLIISEVGLGGHWKDRQGNRYWDEFSDEQVPADVVKNRTEVISACIDAGINYLDISTSAECLAYGAVLKGRRERMYIGADDFKLGAREAERCKVEKLMFDIDQCLRRLQTDYLDMWRVKADMYGDSTDRHMETMIETFEKARKAGKVRFLGISSHCRPWLEEIIEKFDQVQVVSFPVSAKTKSKAGAIAQDNIEEVKVGYGSDTTQSIFDAVRERNIGVVAIKPFLGGNLFESYGQEKFPVTGVGSKEEHDLARLTLQCILTNDAITTTIPGLTSVHEVENAVRSSYTLSAGSSAAERNWLDSITQQRWAKLPKEYHWLRDWEEV